MHSFVEKGFREGFKLAAFGDRHACETCGQVYVLEQVRERAPLLPDTIGPYEFEVTTGDTVAHYTWRPLTH